MNCSRIAVFTLSALTLVSVGTNQSRAQAIPTASKSAEISVFGGYMPATLDYGPHSLKGGSLGADFTIFPHFPVSPSLEVRVSEVSNVDATEKSALAGLRIQRDIRRRLHPYADFLIGLGEISFHPAPYPDYTSDKSKALSYGAGINFDVTRRFAAKLDFQQQHWNLGPNDALDPNQGDFLLRPKTLTVGVTYTIPFRILNRHGDFR